MIRRIERPAKPAIGTKFVPEHRVASLRMLVPATVYRVRARAAVRTIIERAAIDPGQLAAAPFSILHDHFDWKHEIDLEVCVPVRHSIGRGYEYGTRFIEGSAVLFICLADEPGDGSGEAAKAITLLETEAIAQDRIVSGDVREIHHWERAREIEMQLPVI